MVVWLCLLQEVQPAKDQRRRTATSAAGPVELVQLQRIEIRGRYAAQIHCPNGLPIHLAFGKRLGAAGLAEAVANYVLVEQVSDGCIFAVVQGEIVCRDKRQQQPLAPAIRTVATDRFGWQITDYGKFNGSTVARSGVAP